MTYVFNILFQFVALRREVWHRLNQRGSFLDVPVTHSVPRETIIPVRIINLELSDGMTKFLLQLLFAGAFYPNILINRSTIDDVAVGKELLGYNPLHTCVVKCALSLLDNFFEKKN